MEDHRQKTRKPSLRKLKNRLKLSTILSKRFPLFVMFATPLNKVFPFAHLNVLHHTLHAVHVEHDLPESPEDEVLKLHLVLLAKDDQLGQAAHLEILTNQNTVFRSRDLS